MSIQLSAGWQAITKEQLATWAFGIIGPGREGAVDRLYADGFKHTNALRAVQMEDLQRAGFASEEADALIVAVAVGSKSDVALETLMTRQDEQSINMRCLADDHSWRVDKICAKFDADANKLELGAGELINQISAAQDRLAAQTACVRDEMVLMSQLIDQAAPSDCRHLQLLDASMGPLDGTDEDISRRQDDERRVGEIVLLAVKGADMLLSQTESIVGTSRIDSIEAMAAEVEPQIGINLAERHARAETFKAFTQQLKV